MVFDLVSFLAGIGAGALMGALAGVLHGLERTSNLQEQLRVATRRVEEMSSRFASSGLDDTRAKVDDLQRELNEINEQIKQMYRRGSR